MHQANACDTEIASGPTVVVERLGQAISQHDLEALVECFWPDYQSDFPAHPDRSISGTDAARENWTGIFAAVPDIEATLVTSGAAGDTVWAEWAWAGTNVDGTPFTMVGVTVQGVREGRIAWVRLYMEPVVPGGAGASATESRSLTR